MDENIQSPQQFKHTLFRVSIAVLIAISLLQFKFEFLEAFLYDLRVRTQPDENHSGNIEIILIDTQTSTKLKAIPGFHDHAMMLHQLSKSNPKAVVYTRSIAPLQGYENQYSLEESRGFFQGSISEMKEFVTEAGKFHHFYAQIDTLERAANTNELAMIPPLDPIQTGSGPKTSDKNILAKDGITRRIMINYMNQTLLHPRVASLFNLDVLSIKNIRGQVNIFDTQQVYIHYHKPGSFRVTKFEDILNQSVDFSRFDNKLVIVGDDLDFTTKDYVATPYNREATMNLAELHANMFETLITNTPLSPAPNWLNLILTFGIAFITVNVVLIKRPLRGLIILLGTTFLFIFVSWFSFWLLNIWISMSHPLLAIFISYYFFIPYRLILENRRSWEYYQKHKLVSQVEELKTNFISMMSHDIKTPIARIQGMVEIIAKDKNILSQSQHEAIDTIKASSNDLLGFINSILNYAKIESNGVELHKKSKDINLLLEEVVKRHEFLAKLKHIKVKTQLEPLFSLSLDPDLMKQVFSNLLENAIKYSPEESLVTITSAEVNGFVQIKVQDQGPGIPEDELSHVFMKFFRSKNAKSSPIKGSGLGLYLAKYFVELHQGQIFVESSAGNGTCFIVNLPT